MNLIGNPIFCNKPNHNYTKANNEFGLTRASYLYQYGTESHVDYNSFDEERVTQWCYGNC